MKLLEFNWNPGPRQLRQFGWICFGMLPLVAWLWTFSFQWMLGGLSIGAAIAVLGTIAPALIKPIFLGLSLLAFPIGIIVSEAALLLMYFAIIFPIAIIFRLLGRDALKLRIDRRAESYWQAKRAAKSQSSYFRQS